MADDVLPTVEQAAALVAVVEHGSYADAATALGISRPAVIRRVERLRDLIGRGSLLKRGGRNPTQLGELVLQQAERVLDAANGMLRPANEVRLSTYPTIAAHVVASCSELFSADPARAALYDINEASRRDGGARLIRRLADGDVDIVIAPETLSRLGLDHVELYRWTLQIVLAENHPLRKKARAASGLNVADIAHLRIVAAPHAHSSRQLLEQMYLAEAASLRVQFETPNQHLLRQIALSSPRHGAAIPSDAFWPAPEKRIEGVDLVDSAGETKGGWYHVFTRYVPAAERGEREDEIADVASVIVHRLRGRSDTSSVSRK